MASAKKLPSGSWRVNLYIGKTPDGKRQYKSFTADTKKEAEFLAAQYNQNHIDVNRSELPLSAAVERYIKSKENVLSPSTVRGYNNILKNHIPTLMAVKIRDINAEMVQEEFNRFAKDHSPKTCRNTHGLIASVLAIERPDIVLRTTLPQKKKRDIYVPDEKEIDQIHQLIKGNVMELPFVLAAECGLRASEVAALRISSVFPDHIEIKQAMVPDKNNKPTLKDPKSISGYRNIPISKELSEFIIERSSGVEFVCNLSSNNISTNWNRFKENNGLNDDLVFHALRHHFASRCLLLGMPQKYIAELMGHADTTMIEKVYQHVFPSAMEEYANKLREQSKKFIEK